MHISIMPFHCALIRICFWYWQFLCRATVGSTDLNDRRAIGCNYGECVTLFAPVSKLLAICPICVTFSPWLTHCICLCISTSDFSVSRTGLLTLLLQHFHRLEWAWNPQVAIFAIFHTPSTLQGLGEINGARWGEGGLSWDNYICYRKFLG